MTLESETHTENPKKPQNPSPEKSHISLIPQAHYSLSEGSVAIVVVVVVIRIGGLWMRVVQWVVLLVDDW